MLDRVLASTHPPQAVDTPLHQPYPARSKATVDAPSPVSPTQTVNHSTKKMTSHLHSLALSDIVLMPECFRCRVCSSKCVGFFRPPVCFLVRQKYKFVLGLGGLGTPSEELHTGPELSRATCTNAVHLETDGEPAPPSGSTPNQYRRHTHFSVLLYAFVFLYACTVDRFSVQVGTAIKTDRTHQPDGAAQATTAMEVRRPPPRTAIRLRATKETLAWTAATGQRTTSVLPATTAP